MLVINGYEWKSALNGSVASENSLRYNIRNGRECLDLTDYNIDGYLKLTNFANLEELDCSSKRKYHPRTNDHCRNHIIGLDLSGCFGLIELNCSENAELTELNIRNCSNLQKINILGCPKLSKVICDNTPYSPTKIIEKSKLFPCFNGGCKNAASYNGHCDMHQSCKEEGCNSYIHISKEYCSSHQSICIILDCSSRAPLYGECAYHQNKHRCLERGCRSLIHMSKEFCSSHQSNCSILYCSFRTSSPDSECDYHKQKHCCKEEGCNEYIHISKEHCSSHQSSCRIS
ncbi:6124_t:CDS:1 [Racocetra persica]|uniref:6124_t:CDS:1 n=1 Tax=Racocetra persica TaxID=160502 RepID=A0ACA9PTU1_9GLOM|nr:6124_t:CDS:1 [Racocetra persica]